MAAETLPYLPKDLWYLVASYGSVLHRLYFQPLYCHAIWHHSEDDLPDQHDTTTDEPNALALEISHSVKTLWSPYTCTSQERFFLATTKWTDEARVGYVLGNTAWLYTTLMRRNRCQHCTTPLPKGQVYCHGMGCSPRCQAPVRIKRKHTDSRLCSRYVYTHDSLCWQHQLVMQAQAKDESQTNDRR